MQLAVFEAQVALAAKLRRPLFAHVREVGAGTRDGKALGVYADFQAIGPGPPGAVKRP